MQVLLLGGHGKVALHLTPLLLNRAWNVTSVVRNPAHENEILELGKGRKGKLDVLISSLEDIKSASDASKILQTVSPDYVVWSAGTLRSRPFAFPTWFWRLSLFLPYHSTLIKIEMLVLSFICECIC